MSYLLGTGTSRVAGPGLMFGLHHHQDATGLHHHHQPRGPSLKEEPLTTARSWMQTTVSDQNGYVIFHNYKLLMSKL